MEDAASVDRTNESSRGASSTDAECQRVGRRVVRSASRGVGNSEGHVGVIAGTAVHRRETDRVGVCPARGRRTACRAVDRIRGEDRTSRGRRGDKADHVSAQSIDRRGHLGGGHAFAESNRQRATTQGRRGG